ncbi:MAG: hypothetical protein ACI86C_000917 [Candidatus Latescibacterota bacterium]|jgi:hypothetical protein
MKTLLLNIAMLIMAAGAFAQLYVQPNSGIESFIYVDNQVLFVEQGVNLVANPAGDTEASIYLRNDSQLIQGVSNTENSGTGFISVYQDSNSDSYDYNFWGSPIGNQTLNGGTVGNKNFGILSLNDRVDDTDSNQTLTTAGYNGSTTPLTISRRWLYKLEAGSGWSSIQTNNVVGTGHGFIMKGTGVTSHADPFSDPNNQLYDFRGRANNGDIAVTTAVGAPLLTGNPYPSALDLNRVFYDVDNSEITEFIYWDEDRSINSHFYVENKGGYGTWVPMGQDGNGTPAGSDPNGIPGDLLFNPGLYTAPTFISYDQAGNPQPPLPGDNTGAQFARRIAPIGQGFIVTGVATTGLDTSPNQIVIKNSHRRFFLEGLANNSQFRGPGDPIGAADVTTEPYPEPTPETALKFMRIFTSFGESHYRDMVLAFDNKYSTDGFDRGFDAKHPQDASSTDAFFPITIGDEQEMFVIQTLDYESEKHVPIIFNLATQTDLKVQAVEEINLPFQAAYLWDNETNIYRKMTGGNIATITLPAGNYAHRFYIVFRGLRESTASSEGTRAQEEAIASVDFFQNNRAGQLEVANPEGHDIATANIFDMGGRLVVSKANLGSNRSFTFPTSNLSDGVYIVKLLTEDNFVIDHKITVYNNR